MTPKKFYSFLIAVLSLLCLEGQNIEMVIAKNVVFVEKAESYFNRGVKMLRSGEYSKSIKSFRKAIELKGEEWEEAYNNIGLAYLQMGIYDTAMQNFQYVVSLNDLNHNAYVNMGMVQSFQGEDSIALKNFTKAIEINHNATGVYYLRAQLF